jgi:hypothetical protein
MSSEEESGSQVVALEDEEEADEGAETVSRPRPKVGAAAAVAGEEELGEGLEDDLGAVAEEEEEAPAAVEAAPAEWGALPALVLLPCVILLFLVGLMGFELVQGMWGYQQGGRLTGPVTQGIAKIFLDKDALPKD